jgi:8-oxo-dGTP diphosphatase
MQLHTGLVIIKDNKVLTLYKTKYSRFETIGGKVESKETPQECAIREAKEEIGCDVEILEELFQREIHVKNRTMLSHIYLAKITNGTPQLLEPEEFSAIKWIPLSDWKDYIVSENLEQFFTRHITATISYK